MRRSGQIYRGSSAGEKGQRLARIESLRNAIILSDKLFDAMETLSVERDVAAAMLRPEDVADACLMLLKLTRRAHIPDLTIVPTRLQSLGKTSVPNPKPAPE